MNKVPEISESINVYRLIDPKVLLKYEAVIADILFDMKTPTEGRRQFRISPVGGRISFVDYSKIWVAGPMMRRVHKVGERSIWESCQQIYSYTFRS